MHEAIEILESYGIVQDSDSLRVTEIAGKKVERLHEELFTAIVTRQENDYYADLSAERQLDPSPSWQADPLVEMFAPSLIAESTDSTCSDATPLYIRTRSSCHSLSLPHLTWIARKMQFAKSRRLRCHCFA